MVSENSTESLEELLRRFGTDINSGLTQAEAGIRFDKYGPNLIPRPPRNLFQVYIAPLLNWLVNIYLIITSILALLAIFVLPDLWGQVTFWIVFIVLNAAVAIIQQIRAQKKLEALENMSPPKSKVIRDGQIKELRSEALVPGDLIKLEQGDRVPADSRLIKASFLTVNEAPLTGESVPVEKTSENASSVSENGNMVYLGTYVTSGNAIALVIATGSRTRLGSIAETVTRLNTGDIPLRQKVNKVARYLASAVAVYLLISLAYHLVSLYRDGELVAGGVFNTHLLAETASRSLITSMSIMPINIPLLTTVILLAGTLAMARHQVVIRDLSAVESLGRVSVVCTDKTGTITKNEMTVRWLSLPEIKGADHIFGATGTGFDPAGRLFVAADAPESAVGVEFDQVPDSRPAASVGPGSALEMVLVSGMLNNESSIVKVLNKNAGGTAEEASYCAVGDTTDAAILTLFRKSGLDENYFRSIFREIASFPFDSNLKRVSKVFAGGRTVKVEVFTKGATERVLEKCSSLVTGTVNETVALGDQEKGYLIKKAEAFAAHGYRVISLAFKYIDGATQSLSRDSVESGLTYLGFVAIIDPPRDGVLDSVAEAGKAGIRSVMVTGDSLETARSIAGQVGIVRDGDLAFAAYDNRLTDEEFLKTSVFARVSPEDKMAIVRRYKQSNRTVAVTGDGVNDAPALSTADVGIAMGVTGTDVAKQSSDMIIADDSFNSVVVGIREGRGLFQKIRSLIFFYIAVNAAEALVYFGASFIPDFSLLNSWQRIYIFTTAHAIPPLAFISDRLSRDVMSEKPRDGEDIFNRRTTSAMALFIVSLAAVLSLTYLFASSGLVPVMDGNHLGTVPDFGGGALDPVGWAQAKARTLLLTVALLSETLLVLSLRRLNKSAFRTLKDDNYLFVWPFLAFVPVFHLALMYFPGLQAFLNNSLSINLEIIRLTAADWIVALVFALIPIGLLEWYKARVRQHGRFF
ncbi:Ca2+-transporting ATPase [Dehalogenimonas formicexedens]|uniref:Ca2+-transporting ATPase n=1 Tax=Dehalogenimonas formicexedens TaxID=1839801 RepID=A0A1P8F9X0_9CHLR|nr:cation-transporting P-type ATPase [Dehalogenimonas formicexedens]APV45245.1 Ca2+-transporting ATPase [Dehalogenimonas formicexedens]